MENQGSDPAVDHPLISTNAHTVTCTSNSHSLADHLICRESQIVVGLSEEQALQASHWTCSARQDVQGAHKVKGLIRRKHIIPMCFAHKIDLAIEYYRKWSCTHGRLMSTWPSSLSCAGLHGQCYGQWKPRLGLEPEEKLRQFQRIPATQASWPTQGEPSSLDEPRLKACWSTLWRKTWRQAWMPIILRLRQTLLYFWVIER